MSIESLNEVKELMGGLPPLFRVIAGTIDNGCNCATCEHLRHILIEMAKKHDNEIVLNKVNEMPKVI